MIFPTLSLESLLGNLQSNKFSGSLMKHLLNKHSIPPTNYGSFKVCAYIETLQKGKKMRYTMNMKSAQASSYRDRTQEVSSIVERLKKSISPSNAVAGVTSSGGVGGGAGSSTKIEGSRSTVAFQSEFNKRASKILSLGD
ncbi:hypothetical protein LXL04_008885 [Taraxacum kok-saghyz]